MDFDSELCKVGEWGHYQRLVLYCLLVPTILPCAFQAYNQLFMAATPDHWCHLPQQLPLGVDQQMIKNISIPYDNSTGRYSQCQMYDYNFTEHLNTLNLLQNFSVAHAGPPEGAAVVPCGAGGWQYDLPQDTTSVVAQWDLVCSRGFDPTLALVLFGAAGLVGNYVFGYLQDGLGRHPSFFLYLTVLCVFGVATAFAPSYEWWLACRVGVGFTVPAVMSTPFVLSIELVGPRQRTFTTVVMNVGYSCCLILLSAVAYLARDWTHLALITTLPFLAFYFAFRALPESPRWLVARGRIKEAQTIMLTMARVNRRNVPKDFLEKAQERATFLQKVDQEEPSTVNRSYGVLDLFSGPNMARKTLIITFIWFTNTSVYVGLSYYAPSLGGNAYLNFFLAGVSELPTYLFLWPSMEYWGRRWTLCATMMVGGVACIATILTQDNPTHTLILYCIGKFGISSSFAVLPLMASELYPTVVRGVGLSLSAVAGMVGPIVVPLINHLGADMMVLPLLIMGVLLLVGGLCSLLLPETLHQALPSTLQDGEMFGKSLTARDYCTCCPRRRAEKCAAGSTPAPIDPDTPYAGPPTPLDGPPTPLDGPRTPLDGPRTPLHTHHTPLITPTRWDQGTHAECKGTTNDGEEDCTLLEKEKSAAIV